MELPHSLRLNVQSETANFAPVTATWRWTKHVSEVHKRTLLLSEQEWVTDNLVKFGREVSEISEQTDRQTYRHVDHYTSHPYWGCSNNSTRCSRRQQTSSTVQPPSELDKTCTSYLILAHSLHYVKTWRHPQNWKYHYVTYCTLLSEENGATATGNMCSDIWTCDFWNMRVDRQTDIITNYTVSQKNVPPLNCL